MNATQNAVWLVLPVAGAAYPETNPKSFLSHAYNRATHTVLCGKVSPDSILDDEACIEETASCKTCARKLAKLLKGV